MKRFRYEQRIGGTGANAAAVWGPWQNPIELHAAFATLITDATATSRIVTIRHRQGPTLLIGEYPSGSNAASLDSVRITWGQGLYAANAVVAAVERVMMCCIPFALFVNVGETIEMVTYLPGVADQLQSPMLMVRDLDDVVRGR